MNTKISISIMITLVLLSFSAGAVEIRGTVVEGASPHNWTAQEFAGFYYDLDTGESFESLTIQSISGRTIPSNALVYETKPISVNFSYSDDTNKPIYGTVKSYSLVGWQAEKWVALNGKPNKLVKLSIEDDVKRTLYGGSTLTLGNGYVLKVSAVDANAAPRQAWISLLKDGNVIDDTVVQQNTIYNFQKDMGGEKDVLIFSAYVSSIFDGKEAQMIQFQYLWLIDESTFVEVKTSDTYGIFKVTSTNPLRLSNDASLSLSRDSIISLMGNMKFRVADSDVLRFYPMVDIIGTVGDVAPLTSVITTNVSKPCEPTIVEKIVEIEKVVYVNVTPVPTPIPVPTEKSPGFEALFMGVTLVMGVYLNRKLNERMRNN